MGDKMGCGFLCIPEGQLSLRLFYSSLGSLKKVEVLVAQLRPTLCDLWIVACLAPQSMVFSRQEYWSGLPFSSPGDLPNQGSNPALLYRRCILYSLNHACLPAKLLQSCLTLCNPMDYSPPGSSVQGILQARILEWVAVPFSMSEPWGKP